MKWTKQYCIENGPMFIEYETYRYHGHSMSDPGVTYRTRDEIKHVRNYRDPIMLVKHMLIENSWSTDAELKELEKEVRAGIEKDIEQAIADPMLTAEDLYTHVQITRP